MTIEISRYISKDVERELWARAAGRCQFNACNKLLYKSPITQERVNISEKAHIYSFSKDGPRGWGPLLLNRKALNEIGNLLLVCHDCHKTIDQDIAGLKYSASLLQKWKRDHETRIELVTRILPRQKSNVVLFRASIGTDAVSISVDDANHALFPDWFPHEETPIVLEMKWEGRESDPLYWAREEENLLRGFERMIRPLIAEGTHFSIFAFAPMPLLVRLGTLLTEKTAVETYQLQREPVQNWRWNEVASEIAYRISPPQSFEHPPALIVSLSAKVSTDRVHRTIGPNVSIWELSIDAPNRDFLKTRQHLSNFRKTARALIDEIEGRHGTSVPLAIFPAMPVAAAVELGRVRMPKVAMPWVIFDQHDAQAGFVKALEIGGRNQ